jgi:hypothetical protein
MLICVTWLTSTVAPPSKAPPAPLKVVTCDRSSVLPASLASRNKVREPVPSNVVNTGKASVAPPVAKALPWVKVVMAPVGSVPAVSISRLTRLSVVSAGAGIDPPLRTQR